MIKAADNSGYVWYEKLVTGGCSVKKNLLPMFSFQTRMSGTCTVSSRKMGANFEKMTKKI